MTAGNLRSRSQPKTEPNLFTSPKSTEIVEHSFLAANNQFFQIQLHQMLKISVEIFF